jgi:lipoate-protein ligase A
VRTAADNMALDEALLEARGQGLVPNTLRFLQFSPPAVLVGCHQAVEQEVRADFCQRHGIDINRRITGGGTIYFDQSQLGWEVVVAGEEAGSLRHRILLFQRLTEAVVAGLRRLGLDASFRPRNDIEVGGRKISGTGGTEGAGAFLFQGTLLMDFDVDTMLRALRVPVEKLADKEVRSLRERVTWVRQELGYLPTLKEVKRALQAGFEEVLGVRFQEGALTPQEDRLLQRKRPFFASKDWIHQVRAPDSQEVLRSLYKAPGGLLRVALIVDVAMKRIKTAIITGDFFAYPRRAILDLEAALKDAPAEATALGEIVEDFFQRREVLIPGVEPRDLRQALEEALERGSYGRWGIQPREARAVFPVVKPLTEMPPCSVLLLPYCAKPLSCPLRREDGCTECGLCSIGEAYRLAREAGLRPISIVNYEHLQETLARCREEGVRGFIGTCCEAFYVKHRDDFEAIGLPGVLVDIDSTTCYDLGEEAVAYQGAFERQTELRLGLLRKVVEAVGQGRSHAAPVL